MQLKFVNVVAVFFKKLQMTIFLLVKCHKANVCTPMHWGLCKNTKCVIGNLAILRYFNVTNFEKPFFFFFLFHILDFCSILVTKIVLIQYLMEHMLSWVWTHYKIKWIQHLTIVLQGVCMNLNIFVTYEIFKNYYWHCKKR